jgi:hypothetical protein
VKYAVRRRTLEVTDPRDTLIDALIDAGEPTLEELAWDSLSFRRRLLDAAGFDADDALSLSLRPQIGLEELLSLLAGGCPPAVAAQILL